MNKKGVILLLAAFAILFMSILIIGYLEVATTETEIMRNHRMSTKALYVAEGGVQAGIRYIIDNLLTDNNWGNDNGVIYTDVTPTGWDGDYDVELKNGTQDTIDVESTGTVSGFTRTIIQTVTRGGYGSVPEVFKYAMFSFGSHTQFNNSTGTVDGDVASSGTVQDEDDMTITGTVTDGSDVDNPTPVDMGGYKSIADHIESGGYIFTSGTYGSPGDEQIYYIEGNVTIENNVTIYGSVIADLNISMGTTGINIDAASGYPALVSGNNIEGNNLGGTSTISGLIYADNNVDFDNLGDNVTINGSIITGNCTFMRNGGSFTVNYDPDIIDNPPPYFPGAITLSAWQET